MIPHEFSFRAKAFHIFFYTTYEKARGGKMANYQIYRVQRWHTREIE